MVLTVVVTAAFASCEPVPRVERPAIVRIEMRSFGGCSRRAGFATAYVSGIAGLHRSGLSDFRPLFLLPVGPSKS